MAPQTTARKTANSASAARQLRARPDSSRAIGGYVMAATLRQRGWTSAMIEQLLGEPDQREPNPYRPSGPGLKLYDVARVCAVVQTDAYRNSRAAAARRSAAGRAAAATRRRNLAQRAEAMVVTVCRIDLADLERLALKAHNDRIARQARRHRHLDEVPVTLDAPAAERKAIARGYLRERLVGHRLVEYDRDLERSARDAGATVVIDVIQRKIDDAIDTTYPELGA